MDEVTVPDLRNQIGGPRPLPRSRLSASSLVARLRHLPAVDAAAFRADIDAVLDPSL